MRGVGTHSAFVCSLTRCVRAECWADGVMSRLQPHGYAGVFVPKHQSPCPRFGYPADGVGIFYKPSKFTLVATDPVAFLDAQGKPMNQRAAIAVLQSTSTSAPYSLVLACCHLKAKRGFETMRVEQMEQLLRVRVCM